MRPDETLTMGAKGLLKRLHSLEEKMVAGRRFAVFVDHFEAEAKAGIAEGRYDPVDMSEVVVCFRRWLRDGITIRLTRAR